MFYLGKSCFLNGWYSLTSSVKLHQLACLLLNWLNINIGCISTSEKVKKVWNTNRDRIWNTNHNRIWNTSHNRIWPKINFKTQLMQVASKTDHCPFWSQAFFNKQIDRSFFYYCYWSQAMFLLLSYHYFIGWALRKLQEFAPAALLGEQVRLTFYNGDQVRLTFDNLITQCTWEESHIGGHVRHLITQCIVII